MSDHVLNRFRPEERAAAEAAIARAADALACCVTEGLTAAMNRYNRRRAVDESGEAKAGSL